MDKYFGALPTEELGRALVDRLEDNDVFRESGSGRGALIRKCYSYYYGIDEEFGAHGSSQVLRGGEQGELAKVRINHSASLVKTLLNLITSAKLVWSPKAVNTDYESVRQVRLAKALLEYYFHELGFLELGNKVLEQAIGPGAGECFALLEWESDAGDDIAPDPDRDFSMVKTGDVKLSLVPTWDVFRDGRKHSWDDLDWVVVRKHVNKWDLVQQYAANAETDEVAAELRERILNSPALDSDRVKLNDGTEAEIDEIEIFHFFHKHRPSVPFGRRALFLADGTVLEDGPMPYKKWPLKRMAVGELFDTPYPYTPFLDILGIQEVMDSLQTIVASNQTAFGAQYIVADKNSQIEPEDLTAGIRLLYVNGMENAPQPMQLTRTAPEIFSHLESLKSAQELVIGLNSVVRGEPQSGEQSGSALALLQTQAIQQASAMQTSFVRFFQEVGECLFEMLRTNLNGEKQISIVGEGNSFLVESVGITKDSFNKIQRVQVDIGNPMAQTGPGRAQMAQDLMTLGALKNGEQYLEVLETGKLEPMTESLSNELLLIRAENEQMRKGEVPPVLVTDNHMLHAREHRAQLASPAARQDPQLVQTFLAHIAQHEQEWFTASPSLLMMVGQQPPPMPAAPPPGPGGTPPAPPSPSGNPAAGAPPTAGPDLPANPVTGQEWNPVDGGGAVPR